ncbi:hypothetical protein JB92DRAFT_3122023 [Gautieria morchelliformis]|nr:hypothetical protein JB92DRAFT_3122023 [Gautieria morchelliformis]
MPDYHTRLRTSSQILLPRRLRPSPSPPPHRRRPVPQPAFPPPDVVLHPDDAANKTCLAIGRALLAVHNRALTIKDLSHLTLDYGLLCQTCVLLLLTVLTVLTPRSPSAASQAITTFIRTHLARVHRDRAQPLLRSLPLTGTAADDALAPALHSRSGGTSALKDPTRSLTSFRRGTTVWYLSDAAGAQCPFRAAGLDLDRILHPAKGTKRKRPNTHLGPAMATRHRPQPDARHRPPPAAPATAGLRVTLTVKRRDPSPSPSPSVSDDDDDDLSDVDSLDPVEPADPPVSQPADSHSASASHQLPPYPILSPSIPSPSCSTPTTALASPSAPSDPFAPYRTALASFRTALSNPPPDHRDRSTSLPFSAASPPPDSEDEDEDYHNSMVGLRRGSVPLKEEHPRPLDPIIFTAAPSTPCALPLKHEHHPDVLSTPLEVLPGYLSCSPQSDYVSVKDEPISAVLPPDSPHYVWHHLTVKPEPVWEDEHPHLHSDGTGTREDPVHIDTAMHDVEVLGPESVISREWDAAWSSATDSDMDVDTCVPPRPCTPDVFPHRARASPAETLITASTSISSPPSNNPVSLAHEAPTLSHPLRSCDPPVVATVVEGIPVYHTLLAPGVPFLRRIDTSFVNLTPLMLVLKLPLCALVSYSRATPRMMVSRAPEPIGGTWVPLPVAQSVARHAGAGKIPPAILDVFLSPDLGMWFPDALGRLGQLHGCAAVRPETAPAAGREVGIRVEDVFVGAECLDVKRDARLKPDVVELKPDGVELRPDGVELQPSPIKPCAGVVSRGSSLLFDQPRGAYASISMPIALNEQEETLFHSFVDILGSGVSASSSPLSSAPSSPIVKPAVTSAVATMTSSANGKENAAASENAPPPPSQPVVEAGARKGVAPSDTLADEAFLGGKSHGLISSSCTPRDASPLQSHRGPHENVLNGIDPTYPCLNSRFVSRTPFPSLRSVSR